MNALKSSPQNSAPNNNVNTTGSSWLMVGASVAAVLTIIGAAMWFDRTADEAAGSAPGGVTVTVPAGWTEVNTEGCASKSLTIIKTSAPLACLQPGAINVQTLPVAYVSERTSQSSNPIWAEDRLMFGRTTAVDGAVVVSRAPRTPGEGEVFVVAADEGEANRILDELAVRRATAPVGDIAVPEANGGVVSFPTGDIGFMPGTSFDAESANEVRGLLSELPAVAEADTRCLVSIDPAQRGALTTSRGVTQLLFQGPDGAPYQVYLGTEACPVVIDSAGASAALPPDLFKTLAAVVLQDNADARKAFEQAWGPLD